MPKISSKVRAHIRLERATEKEARRIAKEDYGDDTSLSPVVEEALTKLIASRQNGDSIGVILSATEGALFENVSKKIENQFLSFQQRIGDLIAKGGFESVLGTLLIEDMYFKNNRSGKERYEELRGEASRRLRNRLDDAGSDPRIVGTIEENKKLTEQLAKAEKDSKDQRTRSSELANAFNEMKQKNKELQDQVYELNRFYQAFIKSVSQQESKNMIGGSYTIPGSISDLFDEYRKK